MSDSYPPKKKLREILTKVYPNYGRLKIFVENAIGFNLHEVTSPSQALTIVVDELIDWAESIGNIDKLWQELYSENSRQLPKLLGDRYGSKPFLEPDIEVLVSIMDKAKEARACHQIEGLTKRQDAKPLS